MKRFALLATLLLALAACAPAATPPPVPTLPPPRPLPSPTATATAAATPTATLPSTPTAEPCDPARADACVEAGHFLLSVPIPGVPPDDVYLYGTTQGGTRDPHHGVEFPAAAGTDVRAAADGAVVFAGKGGINSVYGPPLWADGDYYGNFVLIRHALPGIDGPVYTLYAHLSAVTIAAGQTVSSGQVIGQVGSTGNALGSHLHFEVRQGGDTYADDRNPLLWLTPYEGLGVLVVRVQDARGEALFIDTNLQLLQTEPGRACSLDLPRAVDGTAYPLPAYDRRNDGRFPVGLDADWREISARAVPAGCYRLVLVQAGLVHERALPVEAGRLTVVIIRVE